MLLLRLNNRAATAIRVAALALITWTVFSADHGPGTSGRGLVVSVSFALAAGAWVIWTVRSLEDRRSLLEAGDLAELWVMAIAGGVLTAACPASAASAFVFVAAVASGLRADLGRALALAITGSVTLAVSELIYGGSAIGTLAYALGFMAVTLAGSNSRSSVLRAEQAELLLVQAQRSHEEQLRAARLAESSRIAREIHDVLAHTLAGLAIQLEATASLLERGADRDDVLLRVRRAHDLARQGLLETRRAVGALRGEPDERELPLAAGLQALVEEHRASSEAPVELVVEGEPERLSPAACETVLRVAQEALTNVRKHAPGAAVELLLEAGSGPREAVLLTVSDHAGPGPREPSPLAASGGGYGIAGMRERAAALGGALSAAASEDGWKVELRLPPEQARDAEPVA